MVQMNGPLIREAREREKKGHGMKGIGNSSLLDAAKGIIG